MIASTSANRPARNNRVGIVFCADRIAGAEATDTCTSSSSTTDSHSSSLFSSSLSSNMLTRLRNLTLLAGLNCLKVEAIGAGLRSSFTLSSSTNLSPCRVSWYSNRD